MPSPANEYQTIEKPTPKRHPWQIVAVLAWIALLILAAFNRQNIYDWWRLRDYQAPAGILTLADEDSMTAYATKIFKVNHPSIQNKSQFNASCPNDGGEQTIVLGCYHSNQAGIFLLSVSDPRLDGVEQVTAAHEMLHAAYDRLSGSERNKVDSMLMDYYNHDLHDQRILNTIAAYKKTEPNAVVNEMHSVFGTEVANLPAPLEQYYQKYFTDRQKITQYAATYEAEFTSRQQQVFQDDAQLATMKAQISSLEATLNDQLNSINSQQSQLNSYKNSGNIGAYNAGVPGYNQLINTYNSEVATLKSLIDNYNALVDTRNSIALTENQLYQELSGSTPAVK
jgi:hypothetical protein